MMENLQQLPLLPGHNYYLHVPMDNGTDGNTFEVGLANITWGHQLSARTNEMSSHAARKLWSMWTNQRSVGFTVYFNFLILRRQCPHNVVAVKAQRDYTDIQYHVCIAHSHNIAVITIIYFDNFLQNDAQCSKSFFEQVGISKWGLWLTCTPISNNPYPSFHNHS